MGYKNFENGLENIISNRYYDEQRYIYKIITNTPYFNLLMSNLIYVSEQNSDTYKSLK